MVSLLFKGVGPWGGGGAMGALMLFGPFAVLVPCIIRLADRGAMVGMIWMVALSPVISMTLSFVVFAIAVSALSPTSSESKDMAFGIVGAVATTTWVLIGLYLIKSGWAYRDEPEDEHLAS